MGFDEYPSLAEEAVETIDKRGAYAQSRGRLVTIAWLTDGCHLRPNILLTQSFDDVVVVAVDEGPRETNELVGEQDGIPTVEICPMIGRSTQFWCAILRESRQGWFLGRRSSPRPR
jgi:hypothetical protein